MLPSSGYFQSIACPFFKSGLCERPHCHFKHIKAGDALSPWSPDDVVVIDHVVKTDPDLVTDLKPQLQATSSQLSSILKAPSGDNVPEYKPTPISQLKYNLKTLDHSRSKRRKWEEYVPEDVKCSKKRVSFNLLQASPKESCITISSEEDEEDSTAKFSDDDDEIQFCPVPDNKAKAERALPKGECEPSQPVNKYSLVDKIITDVSKNEELIRNFKTPKVFSSNEPMSHSTQKNKGISIKAKQIHKSNNSQCERINSLGSKIKHGNAEGIKEEKKVSSKAKDKNSDSKLGDKKSIFSENSKSKKLKSEHSRDKIEKKKDELSRERSKQKESKNSHKASKKKDVSKQKVSHSHRSLEQTLKKNSMPEKSKSQNSSKLKEPKKLQDGKITSSNHPPNSSQAVAEKEEKVSEDEDSNFPADRDSYDSDTYEECYRIFNESIVPKGPEEQISLNKVVPKKEHGSEDFTSDSSRKRLAHSPGFQRSMKTVTKKENPLKMNPAQIMIDRYAKIQNSNSQSSSFASALNKNVNSSKKKVRIAVPSSSLIAAVDQKNKADKARESGTSSSPIEYLPTVPTVLKCAQRMAHVPIAALSPRPVIPATYGSKVPTNIRQKYLNSFIDECLKFCPTEKEAYDRALEEEKKAYERSASKSIYLNLAANAMNRLRHRDSNSAVTSTTWAPRNKTISHETILTGSKSKKYSFSIQKRKPKLQELVSLRGIPLYNCLQEYILTEEQLVQNGFPLAHPTECGRAVIHDAYNRNKVPTSSNPFSRTCSRCSKQYYVDKDGDYVRAEECDFHWGRIFKQRIAGSIESRYNCCQSDAESNGCCVGTGHVYEGSESHLLSGFVQTLPKCQTDKYYGIYSLDCEMCYTTAGSELTRVTVINPDLDAVYETFVKPEHKVLDYNTRFSGISEEDLIGVTTTLRDVQAVLLCLFNEQTILIGHSLESDFKALKLIHKTVVDTSVLFPHRLGFPYKRALRTLMTEKCNKIIQNSIGGHDSHEDAVACMELVFCKMKEDSKFSS